MSGATSEAESLRCFDLQDIAGSFGFVDARALLAGEVGAVCKKGRVVEGGFAVRYRRLHDHVTVDGVSEESRKGDDTGRELHGGGW